MTHPFSEIVISEDGSKDRTVEIVNEFKQRNLDGLPITLLHSDARLGKGGGLKRGIEQLMVSTRYLLTRISRCPLKL